MSSEEIASADARTLIQKDARIAELSRQIGELHTTIGYQDAMIERLRSAAQPAAGLLIDVSHLPLDERTREMIQAVLTPLEAALAASNKARTE